MFEDPTSERPEGDPASPTQRERNGGVAWRAPETENQLRGLAHPFLFLIRDRSTRLIHFLGRCVSPS